MNTASEICAKKHLGRENCIGYTKMNGFLDVLYIEKTHEYMYSAQLLEYQSSKTNIWYSYLSFVN